MAIDKENLHKDSTFVKSLTPEALEVLESYATCYLAIHSDHKHKRLLIKDKFGSLFLDKSSHPILYAKLLTEIYNLANKSDDLLDSTDKDLLLKSFIVAQSSQNDFQNQEYISGLLPEKSFIAYDIDKKDFSIAMPFDSPAAWEEKAKLKKKKDKITIDNVIKDSSLTKLQREVIELRVKGMTFDEISKRLKISKAAAHKRFLLASKKLQENKKKSHG